MTEEVKKLVESLREDAEWALANEWETPITLSDDLGMAADLIEKLTLDGIPGNSGLMRRSMICAKQSWAPSPWQSASIPSRTMRRAAFATA